MFTPSASFKSPHIDGVTWEPAMVSLKKASDGLTKHTQKPQFGIGFEIEKMKLKDNDNQA